MRFGLGYDRANDAGRKSLTVGSGDTHTGDGNLVRVHLLPGCFLKQNSWTQGLTIGAPTQITDSEQEERKVLRNNDLDWFASFPKRKGLRRVTRAAFSDLLIYF